MRPNILVQLQAWTHAWLGVVICLCGDKVSIHDEAIRLHMRAFLAGSTNPSYSPYYPRSSCGFSLIRTLLKKPSRNCYVGKSSFGCCPNLSTHALHEYEGCEQGLSREELKVLAQWDDTCPKVTRIATTESAWTKG